MSTDPKTTDPVIATGDRRDELHYEPDPDQLVKARATAKPDGPLRPQEHSASSDVDQPDGTPLQDVAVAAPGPSVWDARPPEDGEEDDDSHIGARAAH